MLTNHEQQALQRGATQLRRPVSDYEEYVLDRYGLGKRAGKRIARHYCLETGKDTHGIPHWIRSPFPAPGETLGDGHRVVKVWVEQCKDVGEYRCEAMGYATKRGDTRLLINKNAWNQQHPDHPWSPDRWVWVCAVERIESK